MMPSPGNQFTTSSVTENWKFSRTLQ